jgi:hypothetical protein
MSIQVMTQTEINNLFQSDWINVRAYGSQLDYEDYLQSAADDYLAESLKEGN